MRVKTGTVRRQKHTKVLKAAKGFWMTRSKRYKVAHEAVMHAGQYAYNGRRIRKRDLRKLWTKRISAALSAFDIKYSLFIKKMSDKKIILNRKVLSQIALNDSATFEKIVNTVK